MPYSYSWGVGKTPFTKKKKKKVAHSILVRQGPEVRGGPSPWYLVGLKNGERPASCLEHVKSR